MFWTTEESYELVGENIEDKDVDDEDMNQDGIEMEASDMDMSKFLIFLRMFDLKKIFTFLFVSFGLGRIFQGATDEQTKANILQG